MQLAQLARSAWHAWHAAPHASRAGLPARLDAPSAVHLTPLAPPFPPPAAACCRPLCSSLAQLPQRPQGAAPAATLPWRS